VVALFVVRDASTDESAVILGIEPDRLSIVGDGVIVVALCVVRGASIEESTVILGIEPDRLSEVGDGVIVVALCGVREASTAESTVFLGIEPDRLSEVGDGVIVVALCGVRDAPIDESAVILWIAPDHLSVVGDGVIVVVFCVVRDAPIEEGAVILGIESDRLSVVGDGVVVVAPFVVRDASTDESADILLTRDLREVMYEAGEREFVCRRKPAISLDVERPQALFAAWYELFPRSTAATSDRHGTLTDIIGRLPGLQQMGFDVLYLTPIHPIGGTNRKGRNNTLDAAPDDVGSPYAIGNKDGGHDAIHSALGTIEDFRQLRDAAAEHGLELALDFAVQCSPDHPWLKDHPEWFKWRPDGSIRFAENPPKKYEDIVNVDFYAEDAIPDLWLALRNIVLFWVDEGVRIFRVDNPHTKPLPFWEWLINEVRSQHPDVIFLSEAFTRPKMMYRLAKVGFSQSYTYFTWRNTKQDLVEYFTELTTSEVKEFFRPHLFVNTPDINPFFLQTSGRPGFLIRAALAATLSGLWGMYSGFELCEAAPLQGREEYLDSEKYEIRARRFDAPGNIVAEIGKLNRIRKAHPALQTHLGLRFYPAHNDQVIFYGKGLLAGRSLILCAISLDPFHIQEATVEVPLWEWGLPDTASFTAYDLMHDTETVRSGKLQRLRLDPAELPFVIWRIAPLEA